MPYRTTKSAAVLQCDYVYRNGTSCTARLSTGLTQRAFELRREALIEGWEPLDPSDPDDYSLLCPDHVRQREAKERRKRDRETTHNDLSEQT